MSRNEVLEEFNVAWRTSATEAMAAEIVRLREQLAAVTVTEAMVEAGIQGGNAQYEHDVRHTDMSAAARERSMYRAIITAALTAASEGAND